ncbi:14072_t:CDS:2, partial [Dentiscutata erythropus]
MLQNFINLILFALLIAPQGGLLVYAQDTDSGIVSLSNASTGWFVCSKQNTNYIVVPNSAAANDVSGLTVQAHQPPTFPQFGLLTFATNFSGISQFRDPNSASYIYIAALSCADTAVLNCSPNPQTFNTTNIICLAVSNPNNCEMHFSYSISFTSGVGYPPLTVFGSQPSSCPTTTTSSPPSVSTVDPAVYNGQALPQNSGSVNWSKNSNKTPNANTGGNDN